MNTLINILLYIWQLPQNLIGLAMLIYFRGEKRVHAQRGCKFYIAPKMSGGISLGKYIILSPKKLQFQCVFDHEYGHSVQSRYLGWLYLPIVGLCSIVHAATYNGCDNYYIFWTERWANRLGGVDGYAGESDYHAEGLIHTTYAYLINLYK